MPIKKRVLVCGWYGHGNMGDEAFRASFPVLWPDAEFAFSDGIPDYVNERFDAVMLGGGSFLDAGLPNIDLVQIPLALVGIGCGKFIRPNMASVIERSKACVLRDQLSYELLPDALKPKAIVAADLVFARPSWPAWVGKQSSRVCVILSEHFAPRGDCPEWVSSSWGWFCRELAQALDKLARDGMLVQFMPMSTTRAWDDRRASAHVISRMTKAGDAYWHYRRHITEDELLDCMAQSRVVVSQRLHGAIFAQALGCPVVPIVGHDKMQGFAEECGLKAIDYYALNAATIEKTIRAAIAADASAAASSYLTGAREKWRVASAVVQAGLSL